MTKYMRHLKGALTSESSGYIAHVERSRITKYEDTCLEQYTKPRVSITADFQFLSAIALSAVIEIANLENVTDSNM
jgi:hypothetical protein